MCGEKPGRLSYVGAEKHTLGYNIWGGQASVLAALLGPFFPVSLPFSFLCGLISLIYVKQVENFAFISKIPLKSFGGYSGKHYLCTSFRPSAGSEVQKERVL